MKDPPVGFGLASAVVTADSLVQGTVAAGPAVGGFFWQPPAAGLASGFGRASGGPTGFGRASSGLVQPDNFLRRTSISDEEIGLGITAMATAEPSVVMPEATGGFLKANGAKVQFSAAARKKAMALFDDSDDEVLDDKGGEPQAIEPQAPSRSRGAKTFTTAGAAVAVPRGPPPSSLTGGQKRTADAPPDGTPQQRTSTKPGGFKRPRPSLGPVPMLKTPLSAAAEPRTPLITHNGGAQRTPVAPPRTPLSAHLSNGGAQTGPSSGMRRFSAPRVAAAAQSSPSSGLKTPCAPLLVTGTTLAPSPLVSFAARRELAPSPLVPFTGRGGARCTCLHAPMPIHLRASCPSCCATCSGTFAQPGSLAMHARNCPNDNFGEQLDKNLTL